MEFINYYLHRHRKVSLSLWWKEDIHGLLLERGVTRRGISNLNNVELATLNIANGEAKQGGVGGVALHAKLGEGCGVAFDGLTDLSFDRVQLKTNNLTILMSNNFNRGS